MLYYLSVWLKLSELLQPPFFFFCLWATDYLTFISYRQMNYSKLKHYIQET